MISFLPFLSAAGNGPPPGPLGAGAQGPRADGRRHVSVLIIEDEAMIAWTLETMLEDMGFTDIVLASDALEAAQAVARRAPGLIVSDINLGSGPDGIDTAIGIAGPVTPVLFVSGYADDATRGRISLALPAARLLRKPIAADDLERAIDALLDRPRPH